MAGPASGFPVDFGRFVSYEGPAVERPETVPMQSNPPLIEYVGPEEAARRLAGGPDLPGVNEFAVVRNLGYVFWPTEIYPLAPPTPTPLPRIVAFAVDMDGTSTTTEPLALHSLEYMVRRFTGRPGRADWKGLDDVRDYPYVIGNSNYRHTEFLLERYGDLLDEKSFRRSFIEAVLWTLAGMPDAGRKREVILNARNCGLAEMLEDEAFRAAVARGPMDEEETARRARPFVDRFADAFRPRNPSERVAAALDLYYQRYHSILARMREGRGEELARELLGPGRRLVEPMPGYGIFLCLVKGWLGAEAERTAEPLAALWKTVDPDSIPPDRDRCAAGMRLLGERFRRHPAKISLVTASIAFETHAVMREIIRQVREESRDWPLSAATKERIEEGLEDYLAVFDGFVNAGDAHEARLKPHRDLYSIALYRMAVPKNEYRWCVGIEDTEPGIVSLRAAGFGTAVALPNRDTRGQNYRAATHMVHGGLPELILRHGLFLESG